jgi:glutathione S-transferase
MRHVGRKYGLVAKDEKSLARQDMVEQQLNDLRLQHFAFKLVFSPDYEKAKSEIKTMLPEQLGMLSKFLGKHEWLTGNQLTYVDFIAYETLDWFRQFSPGCLSDFPNLSQLMDKFEKIPQIAAYRKSSDYKDWPILGPFAPWGHFK